MLGGAAVDEEELGSTVVVRGVRVVVDVLVVVVLVVVVLVVVGGLVVEVVVGAVSRPNPVQSSRNRNIAATAGTSL